MTGSVAAAEPVKRVVAFDVDGTLLRGQSQVHLVTMLVRRRLAPLSLLLRVLWWFALYRCGRRLDVERIQRRVVASFAGVRQSLVDQLLDDLLEHRLLPDLRPEAVAEIGRLRAEGCAVILTSGSLSPIIQRLAVRLGTDGHVATPVAAATNGCFSGATDGPMLFGEEKLRRLSHFAGIAYGRWELFAAYGDHESDGALLEAARHPVAVSPTRLLLAAARAKGWTIRYW